MMNITFILEMINKKFRTIAMMIANHKWKFVIFTFYLSTDIALHHFFSESPDVSSAVYFHFHLHKMNIYMYISKISRLHENGFIAKGGFQTKTKKIL